jgi:non-specific serine/threonine protein kinase
LMSGHQPLFEPLTARELEIARRICAGLTNHEIAQELTLTYSTVKWYTGQIYSKLGVNSRSKAAVRMEALGLMEARHGAAMPTEPAHNLPAPLTPFIGRRREMDDVKRLLANARLLTLHGPGGSGKTRLALEVALQVRHAFASGITFVDLAPVAHASLVAKAIAHAVGVIENTNETLTETLKRALYSYELLLVIDNFEHVIEAAPLLSDLLAAAPRLKILVTSREILRLSGEQGYPVPPLLLPDIGADPSENSADSEAVALFVQRAMMVSPAFKARDDDVTVIGQICTRLDGLPLAIELAAARCKVLTPQELLARLNARLSTLTSGPRDVPARQRTLRSTIEWSYNLLDEGEKVLFARLAVFRGGRSLEAIEAVCGEELPGDILDVLTGLVDKSLVYQRDGAAGEPRFIMLETIHEYARERLEASGELDALRRRHAEYFVELAERAEPQLRLAQHHRWFRRLETEHENMRAALEWSLNGGDVVLGARLAAALYLFWYAYGYHVEGRDWTARLVERMNGITPVYQARLSFAAGYILVLQDLNLAKDQFTRALNIYRALGDRYGMAWALALVGYTMHKDAEKALALVEESVALMRELDDRPGLAQALNIVGEIARSSGDDERARRVYEECLALSRETGETRRIAYMFANLAMIAQHHGDHAQARNLLIQAIQMEHAMNVRPDIASHLMLFAGTISELGDPVRAAYLLGATAAALERMGAFPQPSDRHEIDRVILAVRKQLDDATFEAAWDDGRKITLEQAVTTVLEEIT